VEALLAQTHVDHGGDGSFVITMIALFAMIIPWFILAYVSWIFWKAKKRDEAEERRRESWRNAPSS
jgi:membrane protein CcdC involved in cytochrome C biogenesis